jgi:hypothetical protein
MSEEKLSRGPWAFEPHGMFGRTTPDGDRFPFGYISTDDPRRPIFQLDTILDFPLDELREVARMMAAAPELLAALKGIVEIVEMCERNGTTLPIPLADARAAITAAEGLGT